MIDYGGPHKDDRRALRPGSWLGQFEIIRLLGRGGFAFTYLASSRSSRTGQMSYWAIKELFPYGVVRETDTGMIYPASRSEEEFFQVAFRLFEREANTLMRFDHPNVVKLTTCFKYNGTGYIIMPYADGTDLNQYCAHQGGHLGQDFQMSEEEILLYLRPLLDALEYVHLHGVLHRDIKPENIFRRVNGQPFLLDFGVAKVEDHWNRKNHGRNTLPVEAVGYTPFEQMRSGGNVGPWTDIYAMGAVLHFLINPYKNRNQKRANNDTLMAIPPPAAEREGVDLYRPLAQMPELAGRYTVGLLSGIDWALRREGKDRPSDVATWRSCLLAETSRAVSRLGQTQAQSELKVFKPNPSLPTPAPGPIPLRTPAPGPILPFSPAMPPVAMPRSADPVAVKMTPPPSTGQSSFVHLPPTETPFWKNPLIVLALLAISIGLAGSIILLLRLW